MQPKLCFLLLGLACFLSGSYQVSAAQHPSVTLTANTTSLAVGETVKLTCRIGNYTLDTPRVLVYFYLEDTFFCHYDIYNSATKHGVFFNPNSENSQETSSLRYGALLSSSAFPVFEIALTPTTSGAHAYKCTLNNLKGTYAQSPAVTITAKAP